MLNGLWKRPVGEDRGYACGAFRCLTIVFRGVPLKMSLAGVCGVRPASFILWVLWTLSEMLAATMK